MTKREALNYANLHLAVARLGIEDYGDLNALLRIEKTLHRWSELECGTGEGQVTRSIERDENGEGKPFLRVQYPTAQGYVDKRWPTADRERGALKRLAAIMARYPKLAAYHQGDPRGCALYVYEKAKLAGIRVYGTELPGQIENCYSSVGVALCV